MRVLYLGTSQFAVPTLEKIIAWPKGQVIGLVTQPDRPAGRGNKIHAPATKIIAQQNNIPVFQPEKLSKDQEIIVQLQALKPDILVMVAFGQILKSNVLEMAPKGVVNLHGSLLPKLRGPAPINWTIINGDHNTGVTTMLTDKGVDTGAMLLKHSITIDSEITAPELFETMATIGADLMIETLEGILSNNITPIPQNESEATYAPLLKKELGIINWSKPASQIHNLVRGLLPWPGTETNYAGTTIKIHKTKLLSPTNTISCDATSFTKPGTIVSAHNNIVIACGDGQLLELIEVQPANKPKMNAHDWANGVRLTVGSALGSSKLASDQ